MANLKPKLAALFLAISGAYLASLAMPRENFWPLIFPAVALLLLSVKSLSWAWAAGIGCVGGLAYYIFQIEWMSLYLGPVPLLALATLEALFFAIAAIASAFIWQRIEKPILLVSALATVFVTRELIATNFPYGGFPWSTLAQTQSDSPLNYFAYLGGETSISLLVAFGSAWFAVAISRPGQWLRSIAFVSATLLIGLLASPPTEAEAGKIRVAWAQGNANAGLFANPVRGSILQNHIDATKTITKAGERLDADVLVWPENAVDTNPLGSTRANQRIANLVDNELKVPLIFGTISERGERVYNSSILWKPQLGPVDWYDKKRPVPFAEYVPNRDFWYSLAPDLVGLISRGYSFGERDGIFELDKTDAGVLICFEIAIDSVARDMVADGAEVIFSQTNNADFGYSDETYQQFAFAKLRAIETGRSIANVSTVGVSAAILPDGSVIDEVDTFTSIAKISELPLRSSLTPAFFFALPIKFLIVATALFLLGLAWRVKTQTSRDNQLSENEADFE